MHKLLVPVDQSENAIRALDHAIRLAQELGGTALHIVNAHEPTIVYGEVALYLPEEKARALQKEHSEDQLRPALERARAANVPFTSEILVGDVPHAIAKCAEDRSCDGIVMGTRGMGTIGSLLLGSVAMKVIHLAKVPVTLVK